MLYLGNAFSLQMVSSFPARINVEEMTYEDFEALIWSIRHNLVINAIGHTDTMNVVNSILDSDFKPNRININLTNNDCLIVFQLIGGRLPEGATELPEGFKYKFIRVTLK